MAIPLPTKHIFISYSRKDEDVMRRIVGFLRNQGFNVWVDNEKLVPGTTVWEEEIEKAIRSASAVVVVLSPDSKQSVWVRREISFAEGFRKRIFPILVAGDEDSSLTLRLITSQYVDIRQNEKAGLNALKAELSSHLRELERIAEEKAAKERARKEAEEKARIEKEEQERKAAKELARKEKESRERKAAEELARKAAEEKRRKVQARDKRANELYTKAQTFEIKKKYEDALKNYNLLKRVDRSYPGIDTPIDDIYPGIDKKVEEIKKELKKEFIANQQKKEASRQKWASLYRANRQRGVLILLLIIIFVTVYFSWPAITAFVRSAQIEVPTQIITTTPFEINHTETIIPTQTQIFTITPEVIPTLDTLTPAVTATPTLGIGSTSVSEIDGMVMVYVPAGEFEMGMSDEDALNRLADCQKDNEECQSDWWAHSQPQHTIYLDAFWIDQTEVTNALYKTCVEAGNCSQPTKTLYYSDPTYANHPVAWVTWTYAEDYCAWAGRRLPTEAEWEKAASWDVKNQRKLINPWGNEPGGQSANDGQCTAFGSIPVGSYESDKSPYGAYDMGSNIAEWVADWYDRGYYAISPSSNPLGPSSGNAHAIRGCFGCAYNSNWCSFNRINPMIPYSYIFYGFRCARDATP